MYGSGSMPSVGDLGGAIELELSPRLKLRLSLNLNLRFLKKGSLKNL
jgi:hypothetical protein